jgi:electron transport complex protein RnfC
MVPKYPQGGEKQLIDAVLGRQVPSGGLPMDVHVVVLNVGTAAAIADAVIEGKPLVQRITTVTGAVQEPANLLLRIGTLFADAITAAGGYRGEPGKIFAGGSMTGTPAPDDSVSMTKATNGIVVLTPEQAKTFAQQPCIRCGRCVAACPARLMPYRLMALCEQGNLETAQNEHLKDCTLCGSCSYVCPARRWMTASFKDAKVALARRK